MGVINHNAILATTQLTEAADSFRDWLDLQAGPPGRRWVELDSRTNSVRTFLIGPDGSKENWDDSDRGDGLRSAAVTRLAEDDDEDGGSPWAWIAVGWGDYGQQLLAGNNRNRFDDRPYAGVDPEDPKV